MNILAAGIQGTPGTRDKHKQDSRVKERCRVAASVPDNSVEQTRWLLHGEIIPMGVSTTESRPLTASGRTK